MEGNKSFNVYKKPEGASNLSRLRQSNSFYQVGVTRGSTRTRASRRAPRTT